MSEQKEFFGEGETVQDALDAALESMGASTDQVEYEVVEEPGRKVFGLGGKVAKVRVWFDSADAEDEAVGDEAGAEASQPVTEVHDDELSDDQIDEIADRAAEVLRTIVGYCGVSDFQIEEYEGDEGELILDLVGPNLAFIIGRHGRTLEALQTVSGAIITKKTGTRYPVVVDVEGYKHRRRQKVVEIALRAAGRAESQGRIVPLKPMTASERRMVHVALRDYKGVTTASEGSGEYRHVVVRPIG